MYRTVVKQVDTFIYLFGRGKKFRREIYWWDQQNTKWCTTGIYETYFKQICNAETWIITKKNKDKIKPMDIKFLRSSEGKQEGIELEIKFLKKLELK